MRWLVVSCCLVTLVLGATPQRECSLSTFYDLSYGTHDPAQRSQKVWDWLHEHGPACTKDQLTLIYVNLAHAMGSADTVRIRAKVEQLYERAK